MECWWPDCNGSKNTAYTYACHFKCISARPTLTSHLATSHILPMTPLSTAALSQKGYKYGNRLNSPSLTDVILFQNSGKLYLGLWLIYENTPLVVVLLLLFFYIFFFFFKGTRARIKNLRPIFLTDNFSKLPEFTVYFITDQTLFSAVPADNTALPYLAKYLSTSLIYYRQCSLLGQFKAFEFRCNPDSAQNTVSIYKLRPTRNLRYHTDCDSLKTALLLTFFLPLSFLCKLGKLRLSSSYVNRFRNRQPDRSVLSLMSYSLLSC